MFAFVVVIVCFAWWSQWWFDWAHGSVIWTFWMSSPWLIEGEPAPSSFKSVIAVSFLGVSFVLEFGSYDPLALTVAAVWFVADSSFLVSSEVLAVVAAALASAAFFFFSSSRRVTCLKMVAYCSFLRDSASLAAASASTYWSSSSTPPSS